MSQKTTIILTTLLIINIGLSLWSLYNERVSQARTCQAIAHINDQVLTKLDGTVYDKATAGIFNECIGNSFFLVPGFSKAEISKLNN